MCKTFCSFSGHIENNAGADSNYTQPMRPMISERETKTKYKIRFEYSVMSLLKGWFYFYEIMYEIPPPQSANMFNCCILTKFLFSKMQILNPCELH